MSNFQCPFCRLKAGHHRQCQYYINWEPKTKRDKEVLSRQQEKLKNTQVVAAWTNQQSKLKHAQN